MAEKEFTNLDLMILSSGDNYTARIVQSPGGEANVSFELPFSEIEVMEFMMGMREPKRGPAETVKAKEFGGALFTAIFGDTGMWGVLRSSIEKTDSQGKGLRIRLRLSEVPELSELPWEYLFNQQENAFYTLSTETPIIRYLDMPKSIEPLGVEMPLKILVVIASPTDQAPLDVDAEWDKVNESLKALIDEGTVVVEKLENATLSALQSKLARDQYNVLHFIGHGEFDKSTDQGVLLLENADGTANPVSAESLAVILKDHDPMRIAVLNACEGGRTSSDDTFAGSAQTLVQQGIPGVVAMQFKVSDTAAITFSSKFYEMISLGYPIDSSVTEARKGIYALGNNVEWGTPVLYMRSPDGKIFKVKEDKVSDDKDKDNGGGMPSISIGGNVGGNVEVAGGDIVKGDVVGGDKISVGNISGSNVALGRGSSVTVDNSSTVVNHFNDAREAIESAPAPDIAKKDANSALEQLETMQDEGEVEQDTVDYLLGKVEGIAPQAVEILINAFTNPGAAVGKGLQLAIKTYRDSRKGK